jgi:hypothetical protein
MSIRVGAGLLVLIGYTLSTGASLLMDAADRGPTERHQETVRDWDEVRLAKVRPLLPPQGVVGFVENPGPDGSNEMLYYLAQYGLAPVVVDRNQPDQDLVLGFFPEASEPPPPPSPRYEVILEDRGIICWQVKGCR